jgi:hypothetical protein
LQILILLPILGTWEFVFETIKLLVLLIRVVIFFLVGWQQEGLLLLLLLLLLLGVWSLKMNEQWREPLSMKIYVSSPPLPAL